MTVQDLMERASKAYYDGEAFLTNEQYDRLEKINGSIIAGEGDTPHAYRMYSLNKHYGDINTGPVNVGLCVESPKLDGAAVSILYVDGDLVHALTRGNGIKGRDITSKLAYLGVPEAINQNGIVQICGEVVARKDVPNSRNFASGALNQKDLAAFYEKVAEGDMKFVAYNVQNEEDWGLSDTYIGDMILLQDMGFLTVENFDTANYPTDGVVYRMAYNQQFNSQGFTSKHPKGAFAFKENQEAVVTKLLDVIWQTGKSGKVTPVGILDPVIIGEAKVSRATLNNIAFIEALDLEIGCDVEIVRSGEIIPCIIGRAGD